MPIIKTEVLEGHLRQHPDERELLVPFLVNFDINSAYTRKSYNTQVSAYIMSGDSNIKQQFGVKEEVLLIISTYPSLQPRTLQAVEQVMHEPPAGGRVDPTVFFLITPDLKAISWMRNYSFINVQSRIPVVFTVAEISAKRLDNYFVRRTISEQLFSRDLFNDQLPLQSDLTFVGRDREVTEILSASKQSQNRGLFGLRKTGKTSVLFKVARLAKRDGMFVLYYDCKDTEFRNLHWKEFLARIIADLSSQLKGGRVTENDSEHISSKFKRVVKAFGSTKKICLIFDEIEWVSPLAKADRHWHTEFVDFWQTMWTTQSELRCISFLIAGVNPTVVEAADFDGMQNPVFSIVTPHYITGLTQREVGALINHVGKWMGISFDEEAVNYIAQRYGGHPLLTRMACSHLHVYLEERREKRPGRVTRELLEVTERDREQDIAIYSRHVIAELGSFYPTEYKMLEMLAAGNVAEFLELSEGSDYTRHLRGYGLLDVSFKTRPTIRIPMISRYINQERAVREGVAPGPQLIEVPHRNVWLRDRAGRITLDIRRLERVARTRGLPGLYGDNGFPEAERFSALSVCSTRMDYEHFINVCNRCFVEPVESLGLSLGKKHYLWNEIKTAYPELFTAIRRTKLYRHNEMHLVLNKQTQTELDALLNEDFFGLSPGQMSDPTFALQQMVIDGLFVATQVELEKLT